MSTLRVILDTNVLVSGIAYPASVPGKILSFWKQGSLDILTSDYILEELRRVLARLTHRHHLTKNEIDDLVDSLALQMEILTPSPTHDPTLRDIDDQPVLAILLEAMRISKADYLITGDGDLLALADRYRIINPRDFWSAHGDF
ncbi:putative toxin-antitoxin system toxin component, PIN family [Leptospirillum ferriphilum]|uniref:DNA-binding protein n=3 Tax=Leptospirillum ferriphilum TaxID=178606 RepID=A0A059XXF0_9BACT|nr:putative toxin-antitoxin system toxin component, PIN family [Leptospirillum ferriphilum]AFS52570.1 putative nucleic acid-binding protein [Leptospirillum ferriphilum ML-04]AIA29991.1 DNA-binding protein [Leptospirillum ferriphilum YSK]MCL5259944.1 putative toxin-antitoxin system toxin component, PIN family [Nitrospirota bacterium]OOH75250.1 putative toxin-antitoxin system toxin component, PIN family [Leptospirillum ferriphilum]